jgi:hypothetical protein
VALRKRWGKTAQAKAAGGRWDPKKRLWFIPYGKIKGSELEKHIVLDAEESKTVSE